MKRKLIVTIAVVGLMAGLLVIPGLAFAWGPMGAGNGPGGGMMGHCPYANTAGIGVSSGAPGGMMGGWPGQRPPNQGNAIDMNSAQQKVETYIASFNNLDLALDEVMEFQNNFYAIVVEKSTGIGAFELLVDKFSGDVYPEMGPNMMWNTKYGMMSGFDGQGMMGGGMMMGGSMMGHGSGAYRSDPAGVPSVNLEQAGTIAQRWLDENQPGTSAEKPDRFYGYYTVHTLTDGQVSGMLSVNAYTGQVWDHTWHGGSIPR